MYASQHEVYRLHAFADRREVSRVAAERFAQLKAAAERRSELRGIAKRAVHGRRSHAAVATTA